MPVLTSNIVEFPQAETDRLFAAMDRARKDLARSGTSALKWAARTLVGSLAAATAVSRKKRPVRRVEKRTYEIETWKSGSRKTFRRHGRNIAEIKERREVRISHSGFAKVLWKYLGASFGGDKSASARAMRFAAKYGSVEMHAGNNPSIALHNRSGYALDALKGGQGAVGRAINAAAVRMEKSIERQVERKLAEACK